MKRISLLLLISVQSYAASISYTPFAKHTGNIHTTCGYSFNEKLNMLTFEHNDYSVSVYKNSYYRQSLVIARRFSTNSKVKLSAQIGAVSGYHIDMLTDCMAVYKKPQILPFLAVGVMIPMNDKMGVEMKTIGMASAISVYYNF